MFDIHKLNKKLLPELKDIAKELGVPRYQKLKKQELIYEILDAQATQASVQKSPHKEDKTKRKRIQKENDKRIENTKSVENKPKKDFFTQERKEHKSKEQRLHKEQKNQYKLPNALQVLHKFRAPHLSFSVLPSCDKPVRMLSEHVVVSFILQHYGS